MVTSLLQSLDTKVDLKIKINDPSDQECTELPLVVDFAEMLYTGRLQCELVAVETCGDWSLIGQVTNDKTNEKLSFNFNSKIF